jgi:hypothetical protein
MNVTTMLRALAVLFGLLAVSNALKPLALSGESGFVFLGRRLAETPNAIAGAAFAVFLAVYAAALWRRKDAAFPMGVAYAGYVTANLYLFSMRGPLAGGELRWFDVGYVVFALAGAWGAVALMARERIGLDGVPPGRNLLRAFALLFALMALSNTLKPFVYSDNVGFVLLGKRLSGTANVAASLCFAAFLAAYAQAIWAERRRALPMGVAYAAYVIANLGLWTVRKPENYETATWFVIPYVIVAVGVSSGAAWLIARHRDRLA